jgi:hypothetical protein
VNGNNLKTEGKPRPELLRIPGIPIPRNPELLPQNPESMLQNPETYMPLSPLVPLAHNFTKLTFDNHLFQ